MENSLQLLGSEVGVIRLGLGLDAEYTHNSDWSLSANWVKSLKACMLIKGSVSREGRRTWQTANHGREWGYILTDLRGWAVGILTFIARKVNDN